MLTADQIAGDTERSQQVALFAQAATYRPIYPDLKWLHAIPNANSHKQVAEGVRAGVSDIFLPVPIYPYHGLYIELKTEARRKEKNGGLSKEQIDFLAYAKGRGYTAWVCYGWTEAWQRIVEYLESKNG